MIKKLFLVSFMLMQTYCFAQVANDDCATAMDYGVFPLSVQPQCPNGAAPYIGDNNDLTNVTPSTPYYFMTGCFGYDTMTTSFADDIWYKYRGTSNATRIMMFGLDTVHVNFYYGTSCVSLQPSACFTYIPSYMDTVFKIYSNNDTTNFYNYIQISSNVPGKQFWYFVCLDQPSFLFAPPTYGTIQINNTVSIDEILQHNYVSFYPNPTNDKLNIKTLSKEQSEIILYDITSHIILKEKFAKSISLNIQLLAKGVYLYEVSNKNGVSIGKFVKN